MKKYLPSLALLAVFETVAVVLWLTKDNLFYSLILAISAALSPWGRRCSWENTSTPDG